ncbi:MAG TPA: UDP-N-acetylglucosamine 1-carboxyvinyltransferase [Thermodesulfobacteriota bacterium]|nr:UDP-N-acetylglucosamine 1-carboxyvinyltransferase [Thermodesulfobacteriota bacterium]
MDTIVIRGGKKLEGEVKISGAKNAVLPILAATLLTSGWNTISNVPKLGDIRTILKLLTELGVDVSEGQKSLRVNTENLKDSEAPYDLVKTMRASVLVLGPLVARLKRAKVSLPGGCAIGARPINLHLKALESMGVKVNIQHGYVEAKAKKIRGARIYFDIPTVTGTENIMMTACLADGTTVLENAAREPEVVNLASALKKMGAKIYGAGTDVITIEGVKTLKPMKHHVMPDRIETCTYMIAAGITGGRVTIVDSDPSHCHAVIEKLQEIGIKVSVHDDGAISIAGGQGLKAADVKTLPYPGFPTDVQAQIMALLSLSQGSSIITENIFENRYMHVAELKRMGADITVQGNTAVVKGVEKLSGASVMATDLRASASLVLAGLAAEGVTEISRVYHLDRGYEDLVGKLSKLGAEIERVKN